MNHLTADDRKALIHELQAMKRKALDEIRAADAEAEADLQLKEQEVRSHADEAEVERLGDLRSAETNVDLVRLRNAEQALQRLADGRYGHCTDCGEQIPRERLLAQPIAIRCAACQAAAENTRRL
jgi:DnaK suppressor protein